MKDKKLLVLALVLGVVVVFACGFALAFLTMPGLSSALFGEPGYGRGMMGYYANPSDASATPSAGYGPGMMGRRGMMGGNNVQPGSQPPGNTAPSSSQSSASTVQMTSSTATQKVGNVNVAIALNPYPPVGFQKTNFDVTLTDAEGQAITDAKIALDLTMPSMWMPPNKLSPQHVSNGKYSAIGNFTMRGWWRIQVIITRGNENQSAYFDLGI